MEKIKDFEWIDLVLYSKGWYENYSSNEDEFFAEVEKVIRLNENRSYERKMRKATIMHFLLSAHEQIISHLSESERTSPHWCATPKRFYERVKEFMWRAETFYGNTVSMDYACARVIIQVMSELTNDQIEFKRPVYGKSRLRIGSMWGERRPISLTYTQMNREAEKCFGKGE